MSLRGAKKAEPSITVAILTWNRLESLIRAIDSIFAQSVKISEIVVVDSGSNDGTSEYLEKTWPDIKLVRLPQNLGCPMGRNIAFANCTGDIVFFLDDDAWLRPDTIEKCLDLFCIHPDLGIVSCRILAPGDTVSFAPEPYPSPVFSGGASAFKREALKVAGLYPPDFFRQAEEADLAMRIWDNGYQIMQLNDAYVVHERQTDSKKERMVLYYAVRNQISITIRRYPLALIPLSLVYETLKYLALGVRKLNLWPVLAALGVSLAFIPVNLRKRKPIEYSTFKTLVRLKLERKRI